MRTLAVILLGLGLFSASALAVDVEAITRPSDDVTLSFIQAGKVAKVLVKDGTSVQQGDLLIQLDDDAEKELVGQLRAEAENPVRVQAADAQLAQKKVDLEKTELAASKEAATIMELEHARLEVVIADLSLALSKFELSQSKRKYEEARIRVDRMGLRSPITGKVERIVIKEGEGADALAKLIRVVKIDPLWIDVPVPLGSANAMSLGDMLQVSFPDHGGAWATTGKVIFKGAVADAASDTLLVRIEVANPNERPAGERVKVNVTDVVAGTPAVAEPTPLPAEAVVEVEAAPAAEPASQPAEAAAVQVELPAAQ